MSKEKSRILKDAQAGDPVALARALVATPSVNPELEESGAAEAALLAATAKLARDPLPGALIVALTADEEHASVGMEALVRSGIRADAAVVCEPTSLAIMLAHKGFVWVEAAFQGRAAHGSRPDVGVDAIEHAGLYLTALGVLRSRLRAGEPHLLLGHASFHAGTIDGGSAPSVYPDACRLILERRTLPEESAADVMEEFQAVLDDLSAERPELEDGPAWVDAAFLNEAGTPAVCFGPGSIAQAHSADEWIDPSEIVTCAAVLERFSHDFLQEDPGEMVTDVFAEAG